MIRRGRDRRLRRRYRRLRPNRRALRVVGRVLAVVGPVVAVAVAVVGLRLVGIAGDLRAARGHLDDAVTHLQDGRLGPARESLAAARALLVDANAGLYGTPDVGIAGMVPVAGTNLDAVRDVVADALAVAGAAEDVLGEAVPLEGADGKLEVSLRAGTVPLDVVDAVQAELEDLAATLPLGSPPDSAVLLPAVRDAAREVHATLVARRQQVDTLSAGLTLLEELSGGNGDRRYLIAVANTAEMRATGGMILSYGVLEGRAGELELVAFGPIDELFLGAGVDPVAVGAPADELARWSGLEPLRLWRNANLVPDPTVVAPRLQAMAEAAGGVPFDGVVHVDPAGLAALLEGVGAVDVPGLGTVDHTNVVDLTLNRAYVDFPDNDQRREVLGDVAEAAFRRLVEGDFPSLRVLAEALARAAEERHLALWSDRVAAAQPSAFFGADAALPAPDDLDHVLLTVQNFSKNKLDYYLDTALDLRGARPGSRPGTLTATVTVTNAAPPGGRASYVFGPNAPGEVAGLYRGVVSLYLPRGTSLVGSTSPASLTSEAGRSVVGFPIELAAGQTTTVTLELALAPRPDEPYHLSLVPVPRVRPTIVSVGLDVDGVALTRAPAPLVVPERLERP
jgi:hypothetical protein